MRGCCVLVACRTSEAMSVCGVGMEFWNYVSVVGNKDISL